MARKTIKIRKLLRTIIVYLCQENYNLKVKVNKAQAHYSCNTLSGNISSHALAHVRTVFENISNFFKALILELKTAQMCLIKYSEQDISPSKPISHGHIHLWILTREDMKLESSDEVYSSPKSVIHSYRTEF